MNRLICSEWYRMRHTYGLIKYFIIGCLLCAVIVVSGCESFSDLSLTATWRLLGENGLMFLIMFIPVIVSVFIGRSFRNKTVYYEIMEGHKMSNIILSKVITITLVMIVGIVLSYVLIFGVISLFNGSGAPIIHIGERILLLIVIIAHMTIVSVLMNMIFRNGILAGLVTYLRFCLIDMMPFLLFQECATTNSVQHWLNYWVLTSQWKQIILSGANFRVIVGIIGSTVIEVALLYIGAIVFMKKVEFR